MSVNNNLKDKRKRQKYTESQAKIRIMSDSGPKGRRQRLIHVVLRKTGNEVVKEMKPLGGCSFCAQDSRTAPGLLRVKSEIVLQFHLIVAFI